MTQNWFYADRQNQQQGPRDDSGLLAAYARGEIVATTLVWREGLPTWVPFAHVAQKLGVTLAQAAPVRSEAVRATQPSKSGSSTWLVILIVGGIGGIVVLAMLAAIALPAYNDYVIRAKVSAARADASHLKVDVSEFFDARQHCPRNTEAPFKAAEAYVTPFVSRIDIGPDRDGGNCRIRLTLRNISSTQVDGKTLSLTRSADGSWSESSDLPTRYLPRTLP